jgi:hypothetical protein
MTTVKLENGKRYKVRNSDEVRCETHGVVTTWGDLDGLQQQCVIDGIDTDVSLECLLSPSRRTTSRD